MRVAAKDHRVEAQAREALPEAANGGARARSRQIFGETIIFVEEPAAKWKIPVGTIVVEGMEIHRPCDHQRQAAAHPPQGQRAQQLQRYARATQSLAWGQRPLESLLALAAAGWRWRLAGPEPAQRAGSAPPPPSRSPPPPRRKPCSRRGEGDKSRGRGRRAGSASPRARPTARMRRRNPASWRRHRWRLVLPPRRLPPRGTFTRR